MSKRAEEKATKYANSVMLSVNHRVDVRDAFWDGYEQAEKDLALTWEDAKLIYHIADELETEGCIKKDRLVGCVFWSEVLRRFNSQREKK